MTHSRPRRRDRMARWIVGLAVAGVLLAINGPTVISFASSTLHSIEINSQSYKEAKGQWSILQVPGKFKINAVHAALLYTGKVLIIAGSGNNPSAFRAGSFKSIIWNPADGSFKLLHTPSDMFCGGHAFLPDGKLLIAGGTTRYEVLQKNVVRAAGVMTVYNNAPNGAPVKLPAGAEFVAPNGRSYRSTEAVTVPAAQRQTSGWIKPGEGEIWVEAMERGKQATIAAKARYAIAGIRGAEAKNVYGVSTRITMEHQNYWASEKSYLFNPATESYERVSNLQLARWYPTLVGLEDGKVLAVSGLNKFGQIIPGQNELYDPATRQWKLEPKLTRKFPTYPALFLLQTGNLFFSGGNSGFGPAEEDRTPGIWDLNNNTFKVVPGLRDPNDLETSGSVLLPPAQAQRYMVVGGGGVGTKRTTTSRIDVADLSNPSPHFEAAGNLPVPTRYPEVVISPDNKVIIAGGSRFYRGEDGSDILECHVYDPATGKLSSLASPTVGRDYHSEALLLPDGRILTLGSNPLYGNKENTTAGFFQKAIEIYSPPYLFHGTRLAITGGPKDLARGQSGTFQVSNAAAVQTVNLLRPAAVTHVTDVEQRSIALGFARNGNSISAMIPEGAGLVPSGWYMLFVNDAKGTPSEARWVHVS
jgi:Domain of unknown function (DUF1929)